MEYNRVSTRIGFLKQSATDYPAQRENIQAIIKYYEQGGQLPKAGVELIYCFDGEHARLGSLEQFADERVGHKNPGWYDVRCLTISTWLPCFG